MDANFNFDLWLRIAQVLNGAHHCNLAEWLKSQRACYSKFAEDFVDAIILSNHDQQRIGSTVNGNREKMKLAAAIYLTLPGQPYLYYGEELGMLGRKPDPCLREPFLWGDPELTTRWRQPRFSKEGKVKSLKEALCDPGSLYYCYKNLIHLRNRYPELGAIRLTGIEPVENDSPGLLMYRRPGENSSFLIIHNLTDQKLEMPAPAERFVIRYATNAKFSISHSSLTLGAYNSLILHLAP